MKLESPGWQNTAWMERRAAAVPRGVSQAHPLFAARASNAELWDVEGRRYIDFCGGIAVVNTGHCHTEVIAAVAQQMQRFTHTCFQVVAYDSYVALAERLNALAPGATPKKTFFMSTGAEAVENAVKIARVHSRRSGIIAFSGGFHGRTMLTLGLTGKVDPYKAGFGPFPAEIFHAPYPCALHGISADDALAGVEKLFKADIEPQRVAAILIEPVAGEGGYYPAPFDFMRRLRELCDRHGILLIADEIQTGIGRTGKMFAVEHCGVEPDIIVLAKGLGGGFPISAVVGRADVMDAAPPGGLGGTYAGSPLGCAAGLAVLDAIERQQLLVQSARLGERLQKELRSLAHQYPVIGDVRGLGLMVAFELFDASQAPAADLTKALVVEARKRGLLLLSCGIHGNVIRLMAPLTVSEAIVDEAMKILADALEAATAAH
jgi:4-aminobutyrate aminotransferase/4-aminobutyrate aminotransferase/(S)-3-amino-2-methylpropionate transaminase